MGMACVNESCVRAARFGTSATDDGGGSRARPEPRRAGAAALEQHAAAVYSPSFFFRRC
jgi:hypothetical protein